MGLIAIVIAAPAGAFVYHGLTTTTAASVTRAVADYRAAERSATLSSPTAYPEASPSPTLLASLIGAPARATIPGPGNGVPGARGTTSASAGSSTVAAPGACDWACPSGHLPEGGVYTWYQCGRTDGSCTGAADEPAAGESLAGQYRNFPREGLRTVTITGGDTYTVKHTYANEHQDTFELSTDGAAVYLHRYRVDITVAGVTRTTDIVQSPAPANFRFPLHVGQSWSGTWKDQNGQGDAQYTVSVLDRQVIDVGGSPVKTWVVQFDTTLTGPHVTGRHTIKQWIAPQFGINVQDFYQENLNNDGIPYQGQWLMTLASLKPAQ
ncbi:MAG: hypothetical protein ACYDGR_00150 [Candidatus Dormibacteria bacterium]